MLLYGKRNKNNAEHGRKEKEMNKNKKKTLAGLTKLEKTVIWNMFEEGFACDDYESNFMSWGVDGKEERGALASLVKKGVVCVEIDGHDRPVYLANGYTKREVAAAVGYQLRH